MSKGGCENKLHKYGDLFSQLPSLIFTKGANISGGHCMLCYVYFYIMVVFVALPFI